MSYHDSVLLQKISISIYQSIIAIQQQQPDLLIAKYRTINWQIPANKSALISKFITILSQTQTWDELLQKLQSSLKAILVSEAFNSTIILDLIASIGQLNSENHQLNNTHSPLRQSSAMAVLLLDAENLQLNPHTEKFLTTTCTYPLQVKIAFANWSNRGKLDIELHERGYDLIHVPAGRDNADGKMIAVGSSIHERYPHVQEVFVCSSDKVMTNLCNTLQQNGILVYHVTQQGENMKIFNTATSSTINYSLKPLPDIPPIEQFIPQVKSLIKLEQKQTANYWIKLSLLSKQFKNKHQLTISQILDHHFPNQKAKDVFMQYPSDFVVHQIDEKSELYITLFQQYVEKSEQLENDAYLSTNSQVLSTVNSAADLEQVIRNILIEVNSVDNHKSVDLSILGSKFYQRYRKPITEQIKELHIGDSFVKFIRSCKSLQIQQVGNRWEVNVKRSEL
ncbi:MAG: NYN domain-containing protein [Cuspidothrix sp.]